MSTPSSEQSDQLGISSGQEPNRENLSKVLREKMSTSPSNFTNNELAQERTRLAKERNEFAQTRTEMSKERTRMASERTLLAWVRTSLSMISFGFGIDRVFKYLRGTEIAANIDTIRQIRQERILGLSLIVLGVIAACGALFEHWRLLRRIEKSDSFSYKPRLSLGTVMVAMLVLIGIFAFVVVLILDKQLPQMASVFSVKLRQN